MRVALVNPAWTFDGSIYFGCREAHLPLELGYTQALLEARGHEVLVADAHLGLSWKTGETAGPISQSDLTAVVGAFAPRATVLPTAPSYLFWRCAPPELRVPLRTLAAIREVAGATIVVGPHASTTPRATLRKLRADVAVLGECEDVVARLADLPPERWCEVPSTARLEAEDLVFGGREQRLVRNATDLQTLPALRWPLAAIRGHGHHHHRFDVEPSGPGAEVEASRGCPYHCTFCAKDNFRDGYRKRPLAVVLAEIDRLIEQGVRYVYFIDEIFLPDRQLLEAMAERDVQFGVQLRIDNWTPELLELLGRAGCISIEGGMESITERGRSLLGKRCRLSTAELTELFIVAKKYVAFVQANLLDAQTDDAKDVAVWREKLRAHGVWANDPVPLFPYPGSPEFGLRFGACEDDAWERAHAEYMRAFSGFSDIQDGAPRTIAELRGEAVKRVLLTTDAVGGVFTYAITLATELSARGIGVHLATMGPPLGDEQRALVTTVRGLVLHESVFALEWMEEPWDSVDEAGEWLSDLVEVSRPDVVHLNGYAHGMLDLGAPKVVAAHSCVLSWWEAVLGEPAPERYGEYRRRVQAGLRGADVVVACSDAMRLALDRHYGPLADVRVVHNGAADVGSISVPKEPFVLACGRAWDQAKNVAALARVAPRLDWPVRLAGWDNEERATFEALGWLGRDALADCMSRASIFALPARYEPFGLSALEAALRGAALVLGDLPSQREIWGDAATFVDPSDDEALAGALTRLIADGPHRVALGARARARAASFTAARMTDELVAAYDAARAVHRQGAVGCA